MATKQAEMNMEGSTRKAGTAPEPGRASERTAGYSRARELIAQAWGELERNRIEQMQAQLDAARQSLTDYLAGARLDSPEENRQIAGLKEDLQKLWAWALQNLVWPEATRHIPSSPPDAVAECFLPLKDWKALEDLANALLDEPTAAAGTDAGIRAFCALLDRERDRFVQALQPYKPTACRRWLQGFDSVTELVRRHQYTHAWLLSQMVEKDNQHSRLSATAAWERLAEGIMNEVCQYWIWVYGEAVASPNPIERFEHALSELDKDLKALAQKYWREDQQDPPSLELVRGILRSLQHLRTPEELAEGMARVPVQEWDNFHEKLERALVERYREEVTALSSGNVLSRLQTASRPGPMAGIIEAGWEADELVRTPVWREDLVQRFKEFRSALALIGAVVLLGLLLVTGLVLLVLGGSTLGLWVIAALLALLLGYFLWLGGSILQRLLPRLGGAGRKHLWGAMGKAA